MSKEVVRLSIQSFEDLGYSDLADLYFAFVETLIENNYIIEIYHIYEGEHRISDIPLTEISEISHLNKFKKSLGYPFKPK